MTPPRVVAELKGNAFRNLKRVEDLVKIYEDTKGEGGGRRDVSKTDVLRAAVVLLHATLENFLRDAALWKWTTNPSLEIVNMVGFDGNRDKKFHMGELLNWRGRTVDDVIDQSIRRHLERSNYNNTDDMSAVLTTLGVDVSDVNQHFVDISKMIDRRHLIVHRGDKNPNTGRGHHEAAPIRPSTVGYWAASVWQFVNDVCDKLT